MLEDFQVRTTERLFPVAAATFSFFGITVVIAVVTCICCTFWMIRKMKRESIHLGREAAACPTQHANGEYVGMPTNTGKQNAEEPSTAPFQQPPPSAPPIGFCDPPAVCLPPVGRPYPEAAAPEQYPPQYPINTEPYPLESPPPYSSVYPTNKN